MTKCINKEMRDLLPDFVHGQLDQARSAEVREHVASCDECAWELALLNEIVAAAPQAPVMNVERIVSALPTSTRHGLLLHRGGATESEADVRPIRERGSTSRGFWSHPGLRIAAGIAVVAAGGLSLMVGRDVLRPEVQVGGAKPPSASTEVALAPTQTAPVAPAPVTGPAVTKASVPATVVATTSGLSLGNELEELSDAHLSTLLDEIDQMDVLPGVEPESMEQGIGGADSTSGFDQ